MSKEGSMHANLSEVGMIDTDVVHLVVAIIKMSASCTRQKARRIHNLPGISMVKKSKITGRCSLCENDM